MDGWLHKVTGGVQRLGGKAMGLFGAADDVSGGAVSGRYNLWSGLISRANTNSTLGSAAFLRGATTSRHGTLLAAANLLVPELLLQLRRRWYQQAGLAGTDTTHSYTSTSNLSVLHSTTIGDKTYKPTFGIYPRSCKWRDEVSDNSTQVDYEYWDDAAQHWSHQQPAACVLQGFRKPGPPRPWQMYKNNPRTEVVPSQHHVIYRNLWYNRGRWYALVDSSRQVAAWKFSKNQEINTLHVKDARRWAEHTNWRVGIDFKRPCDQMVLLHLKRTHLMEWVRAVMAVALGVGRQQQLPPIWLQQETDVPWEQLGRCSMCGAKYPATCVQVLIVRDLFTGGTRSFTNTVDARAFRAAVYSNYGLPPPALRRQLPRVITFQRKRANRRIINEEPFLQLLSQYGELRVVEFNSSTSFADQLATMRDTGVFVSAHTSNLANAVLLQPGSAVVEIIQ
eukprot:gene6840-7058_t